MRPHSKYRAIRTEVDGIVFASKREAKRYQELKMLERVGVISALKLQPRFPIAVNGERICVYVADFEYAEKGKRKIEDAKGVKTPVYRLKKKLVEAQYGIEIEEV